MFKIPPGNVIAFDCEATGLSWRKGDRAYCFSFCNDKGDTSVISFPVDPKTRKVNYNHADLPILISFFENPLITKVAHNAQYDIGMVRAMGIKVRGNIVCTMNLIRLVRSDAPMALKKFCKECLGIGIEDEDELKDTVRKARREGKAKGYAIYRGSETEDGSLAPDYWLAPSAMVERYAITDAARCMAVYQTLKPEIQNGQQKLWEQENKTWQILRKIEKRGIRIYKEKVLSHSHNVKKKLHAYQKKAHKIVGGAINLNSAPQLRKIFYEQLKESPKFLTPSGFPSTDVDSLRGMRHELAKIILNIRACTKTLEFMKQYLYYMVKHKDGCYYIHPTINQSMSVTGRESCQNPNLQQVASGRNDKGIEVLVEARSVFGPRPNYQMRSYDWKNIEVFIPAFASGEEKLTKILKEGGDVHQFTANNLTRLLEKPVDRDKAKRIFFGLLYGIGSKKLAKLLGLEKELADQIVWGFKKEYPILADWMEGLKNEGASQGYVKTAFGRVIRLSPEEYYKAPNYYVQGTAGGILRNAKIKIVEAFKTNKVNAHIVLPIHDELLIEIGQGEDLEEDVDEMVVHCMQDNPELNMPIPIPVSISAIGEHWANKKKVKTI